MNYETYHIPANYTDAGKILGIFEIRNLVEAVVLGVPLLFACLAYLPLALTTKVVVTLIIFVPIVGFALIGINDDSLTQYLWMLCRWRQRKRILTYRGEIFPPYRALPPPSVACRLNLWMIFQPCPALHLPQTAFPKY
ncbi:hypothetical protein FACS189492_3000 [Clostridia bacterium]|nr:hypothetical protein FACS189492_3000 [Clostridia bacterium]